MPLVYTVTATVEALHVMVCESCNQRFGHILRRKVHGSCSAHLGASSETAYAAADADAVANGARLLEYPDPVFCPTCGWLQVDMVRRVKENYLRWLVLAGVVAVCFGICFMLAPVINSIQNPAQRLPEAWLVFFGGLLLTLAGTIALTLRLILVRRLDLNGLPLETRLASAKITCLSPEQLAAMEAQTGALLPLGRTDAHATKVSRSVVPI